MPSRRPSGCALVVIASVIASVIAGSVRAVQADEPPVRIDGVAALVGGSSPGPGVDVILRSDVELRARMALAGRTSADLPLGPVPGALLRATLSEIIGEHLLAREARRVQVGSVGPGDRAQERAQFVRAVGGDERFGALVRALGIELAELDAIAERRALAAAFLRANLEGATVVSSAEVEHVWESERQGVVPENRPDALKALRARLAREALDRAIARWVGVLSARTVVEIHANYDGE